LVAIATSRAASDAQGPRYATAFLGPTRPTRPCVPRRGLPTFARSLESLVGTGLPNCCADIVAFFEQFVREFAKGSTLSEHPISPLEDATVLVILLVLWHVYLNRSQRYCSPRGLSKLQSTNPEAAGAQSTTGGYAPQVRFQSTAIAVIAAHLAAAGAAIDRSIDTLVMCEMAHDVCPRNALLYKQLVIRTF
jgi:hypothetical protein